MRKMIFVLILSMSLIFGCANEGGTVKQSPYIGGIEGLTAEFEPMGIEENGVYTIYQDEFFPIQVTLKNKGEEDIGVGDARIKLYGILLSDFTGVAGENLTNRQLIEKISETNPTGGETLIDFGPEVRYRQNISGIFYDVTVFASYTYRYKTHASVPEVCFKEDLTDKRICEVEEGKGAYSSAAPIQVKSVGEMPAGAGIVQLNFEVENVGGGEVTLPGQEFARRYGQISYTIEPATERDKWRCTSGGRENEARLVDGKATINCKLTTALPKDTLYVKEIGLTINYDYRDIIKDTVRIKKAG